MDKICPCGKTFFVKTWLLNRKKYCSKICFYKYMPHRSGYKCTIKKDNPTWFKKGHTPWSKGLGGTGIKKATGGSFKKGKHYSTSTEFTSDTVSDEKNYKWKGDKVGYHALHAWIVRKLGKANKCTKCGLDKIPKGKKRYFHWANISGEYKRDLSDWIQLCHKCHFQYDKGSWGNATKLWKLKNIA